MAKARHPCSASRVFARYRPGVNKTVTRPCDVMMREIQLLWRTGTQLVKCSVSDRRSEVHLVAPIYISNPLKVHRSGVLPAKMQAVLGLEDI